MDSAWGGREEPDDGFFVLSVHRDPWGDMHMRELSKVAVSLTLFVVGFSSAAHADNCSGHYTSVVTTYEVLEIDKGHTVVVLANRNSASSGGVLYNGVGGCSATILTTPDGKFQMNYSCVRKSPEGESWSIVGTLDSSSTKGSWTQVAGTGRYSATNGSSGWFQPLMNDGKMELGTWGGNCR